MRRPKELKTIKPRAALCLRLWKELVKTRAGYRCEICGCTHKQLHAHHLIDAGVLLFRYDPNNGLCLCASCHKLDKHRSAHRNPIWFENALWEKHPKRWVWWIRNHETYNGQPVPKLGDYPGIADYLEHELKEISHA